MTGGPSAGLAGALVGLALGILQFWIAADRARRRMRMGAMESTEQLAPEHKAAFDRQVAFVRRLLFWSTVMIYPVLGFAFGRALGAK